MITLENAIVDFFCKVNIQILSSFLATTWEFWQTSSVPSVC